MIVTTSDLDSTTLVLHIVLFNVIFHSLELIFTGVKANHLSSRKLGDLQHRSPNTAANILKHKCIHKNKTL